MNMWVQAETVAPSPAEIAARRARLMGRGNVVNITTRQPKAIEPPQERPDEPHDAHVKAYAEYLAQVAECLSPGAYIRLRCRVLDLPYDKIMSDSRKRAIVDARLQMIWEVRARYPNLSTTQIGRIFCRDHATVLHSLKKGGCQTQRRDTSVEQIAEMKRLRAEGLFQRTIACRMGISQSTVSRYLRMEEARAE